MQCTLTSKEARACPPGVSYIYGQLLVRGGRPGPFCANKGFKLNDETTKALGRSSASVYALRAQLLDIDWKRTRGTGTELNDVIGAAIHQVRGPRWDRPIAVLSRAKGRDQDPQGTN